MPRCRSLPRRGRQELLLKTVPHPAQRISSLTGNRTVQSSRRQKFAGVLCILPSLETNTSSALPPETLRDNFGEKGFPHTMILREFFEIRSKKNLDLSDEDRAAYNELKRERSDRVGKR